MIRQLGASTFFVTLSAAETRWTHLLLILGKLIDNKIYTEEEIAALTWQDKCRLIQSDPVTCARHFDYSVNKFLNEFLLTSASPLGEIEDYFYRVEYQNRGSPASPTARADRQSAHVYLPAHVHRNARRATMALAAAAKLALTSVQPVMRSRASSPRERTPRGERHGAERTNA